METKRGRGRPRNHTISSRPGPPFRTLALRGKVNIEDHCHTRMSKSKLSVPAFSSSTLSTGIADFRPRPLLGMLYGPIQLYKVITVSKPVQARVDEPTVVPLVKEENKGFVEGHGDACSLDPEFANVCEPEFVDVCEYPLEYPPRDLGLVKEDPLSVVSETPPHLAMTHAASVPGENVSATVASKPVSSEPTYFTISPAGVVPAASIPSPVESSTVASAAASSRPTSALNHTCGMCGKGFKAKCGLVQHVRMHTREKPFICDVCTMGFTQKSTLKAHMTIHSKIPTHECEECGKHFKSRHYLELHLAAAIHWRPSASSYVCEICGASFKRQYKLKCHHLIHSDQRPYACKECPKSYRMPSHLRNHMRCHTKERPFSCAICMRTFAQSSHLWYHRRVHAGTKPHVCDVCRHRFITKSQLDTHKMVHLKERAFRCKICQKGFCSKYSMLNHEDKCAKLSGVRLSSSRAFSKESEISFESGNGLTVKCEVSSDDCLDLPNSLSEDCNEIVNTENVLSMKCEVSSDDYVDSTDACCDDRVDLPNSLSEDCDEIVKTENVLSMKCEVSNDDYMDSTLREECDEGVKMKKNVLKC